MGSLREFLDGGQDRTKRLNSSIDEAMRYFLGPTGVDQRIGAVAELNPVNDIYQAGANMRDGDYIRAATNTAAAAVPLAGAVAAKPLAKTLAQGSDDAGRAIVDALTMYQTGGQKAVGDFVADQDGAIFPFGTSVDEVVDYTKSGDAIYHSGTSGAAEEMHKYGIDPMNDGPWIREIAAGSVDGDIEDFLSKNPPAAWWSDEPNWIKAKVARAAKKHQSEVTAEDVRRHGHLAIGSASDYADDAFRVGEDGLNNGEYSTVTTLGGDERKLYETPLYEHGDDGVSRYPFGVERNEIITGEAIEPKYSLTGNELVDFMQRRGDLPARAQSSLSPAQTEAQNVLDLLKSGRADEVTDDMLAAADDMYLFDNYDLPMDEASRMARADGMGLTDDALHGSDQSLSAFDAFPASGNPGVYTTGDPDIAQIYAEKKNILDGSGQPQILPLRQNPENVRKFGADDYRVQYSPTNIRAKFARFDPRLKHLRNLSAGIGGMGLLGGLQSQDDEERALREYLTQ